MILVLDASVIVKCLLREPDREDGTEQALAIMRAVVNGTMEIQQPVHWLAEVAAVMARLSPGTARDDIQRLGAFEFPVRDGPQVMSCAVELAVESGHHLFDTLYHAVALDAEDGWLVTADSAYLRKARGRGRIVGLAQWDSPRS